MQIDVRLDEFVLRALQHNTSARYQAAVQVREDIDAVQSSTGGGPIPPGVNYEPLPSSRASPLDTSFHCTTTSGANCLPAKDISKKNIASTRRLTTTLFILGLLAIGSIGGHYLVNRKTRDTIKIENPNTTSETSNPYFSLLVSLGVTTEKELEAV